MNVSSEAKRIADKIKGKASAKEETAEGEPADEKDSIDEEAKTAAAEAMFKAIRGREPSEEEARATEEAMSMYMEACGY